MWYWLSKMEKSTRGKEVAIPGLEDASSLRAPGRDSGSQKKDMASRMEGVSALPDQDGPARQKDSAQWFQSTGSGTKWGEGPDLCVLLASASETLNCFICETGTKILPPWQGH